MRKTSCELSSSRPSCARRRTAHRADLVVSLAHPNRRTPIQGFVFEFEASDNNNSG